MKNRGSSWIFWYENVPADAIAQRYDVNPNNLTLGLVTARGQVVGSLDNLQAVVSSNIAGGTILAGAQITDGEIQGEIQAQGIRLAQLSPQVPPLLQAPFTGNVQLASPLADLSLNRTQALGQGQLNIAGGTFKSQATSAPDNGKRWCKPMGCNWVNSQ
uniref:Uncharacterized protein n=1 Tax=Desertifilum tharense IPPAS B-1220 TaxID=1781255 RepID=A0ACD5GW17_9CYAN